MRDGLKRLHRAVDDEPRTRPLVGISASLRSPERQSATHLREDALLVSFAAIPARVSPERAGLALAIKS